MTQDEAVQIRASALTHAMQLAAMGGLGGVGGMQDKVTGAAKAFEEYLLGKSPAPPRTSATLLKAS